MKEFYTDIFDVEIKSLAIVYVNYCCIFMAQLKSVGEN